MERVIGHSDSRGAILIGFLVKTFEQGRKGEGRTNHADRKEKNIPSKGNRKCKVLKPVVGGALEGKTRSIVIVKTQKIKYWQAHGEIGPLVHCGWECHMVQLFARKNSLAIPPKVKPKITIGPSHSTPRTYAKELKAGI